MATKIRLQRFGKKGKPFFHVVVADSRSPRDGKFIERLGSYNPNTNPATIEINFEKALNWVNNGAEPTDTSPCYPFLQRCFIQKTFRRWCLKKVL